MSKKSITWIELLKEKISLKGKGTSIGDVAPEAKKEWVQIKEGKHPKYTQGKMTKSSTKKNKSGKMNKGKCFSKKNNSSMMYQLLNSKKICSSCKKEIKRMMNKSQSGGEAGSSEADTGSCGKTTDELTGQSGGGCGCGGNSLMSGGCGDSTCSAIPNDGSLLSQNGGKKGMRSSKKGSKKGRKNAKKTRKGKKHGGSNMDENEDKSEVEEVEEVEEVKEVEE
jgi:hypothetical protein